MPVTAKLSKEFYEKLGDDVANELVNWFNDVDATYRNDLRELNELNFARFDAKLEQRVAQLDAKLEQRVAQLDAKIEQRAADLKAELQAGLASLEGRLLARIGVLEGGLVAAQAMRRFFQSTFNRTLLLLLVAHTLSLVWLGPDLRRAVAAKPEHSSAWAVVLLVWGLALMAWALLETDADQELDDEYWRRRF